MEGYRAAVSSEPVELRLLWSQKLPMPLDAKRMGRERCGVHFALREASLQAGHAWAAAMSSSCPEDLVHASPLPWNPAALFPDHP